MSRPAARQSAAADAYDRERHQHEQIAKAVAYADATGLCPICRQRKRAWAITCGQVECVRGWLFPGKNRNK